MNYNTVFAPTASAKRLAQKVFSVRTAIACAVFVFELACDAYESGQIVRGWYEAARSWWTATGCDACAAKFAPCVSVIKAVIAWAFGIDRAWSAKNIPATVVAAQLAFADAKAAYRSAGNRAVAFVDNYLMGV